MALATQCPHCLTIFRVASDQLKLRGGLVRCGSCREVFNGNEFLVEASIADGHYQPAPGSKAQPGTLVAAAPAAGSGTAPGTGLPSAPAPVAYTQARPESIPVTVPEPPAPSASFIPPAPAAAATPAIPVIAEPKVFRSPASPGYIPDLGAPLKSAQPVDKDNPEPFGTPLQDEEPDSGALLRRSSAEPEDLAAPPEVAAVFRIDAEPEHTQEDVLHDPDVSAEDTAVAEEPGFVKRAERKARIGHVTKMLMMILAGVMVPVLLLQALYYWRNPLAASVPVLRPMLNGMCVAFHCSVGLPAEIDRLSLESNELQVVPPNQNVYALTVVMRNRSTSAQAWPHIELTLNNDDEKAVIRRVFRPRDYLSDPSLIDSGLGADSERQIRLNFELKDALVSGYRIYLFYP